MLISERSPSLNWEAASIDQSGQSMVWVWYRPIAIPTGMIIAIPAAMFADVSTAVRLSLRQVVRGLGFDPVQILCWTVNGIRFDGLGGTSVLLDQVLPCPQNGATLEISVWMAHGQPSWPSVPAPSAGFVMNGAHPAARSAGGISPEDELLLEAIEANWKDVIALEVRVAGLRKEIGAVTARLGSLNRDLSSHERLACSTKDLGDWADCRRALRDAMTVMARSIKEIDLGTTSGAGRRHQFEETHRNHVVMRLPFPGIKQAVNEFETYRKILQSVIGAAQASLTRGARDSEMRAQAFLQRIHAKAMKKGKGEKYLFSKSFPPPV